MSCLTDQVYRSLCGRIEELELKLGTENKPKDHLLKTIQNVEQGLNGIASKRDRFRQAFEKAPEIAQLTSTDYEADIDQDEIEYKTQYLLSRDAEITDACSKLESIQQLSLMCLGEDNSLGEMTNLAKHGGKMAQLQKVQIDNKEKLDNLSDDVMHLMKTYNDVINALSIQFVQWDAKLRKLQEIKDEQKPQ